MCRQRVIRTAKQCTPVLKRYAMVLSGRSCSLPCAALRSIFEERPMSGGCICSLSVSWHLRGAQWTIGSPIVCTLFDQFMSSSCFVEPLLQQLWCSRD